MEWYVLGAVLLGAFVAAYFLAPSPKVENAKPANLDDFTFPRADEGDPVPLVFGTVRLRAPNTLWYGHLRVFPQKVNVKTGVFSSKDVIKGYQYCLGLQLGLCLGTGSTKLLKIWAGKDVAWSGLRDTTGDFYLSNRELFGGDDSRGGMQGYIGFYQGAFTQLQDDELVRQLGNEVPNYGGICYVVFKQNADTPFYFGTTPQLPELNFELQQLTDLLATGHGTMPNGKDSNPVEILYDIMTSTWGRIGLSSTALDLTSWQVAADQLYAEHFGLSMLIGSANTGKDVVAEVLRHIDGIMYQDPTTGKIVLKLIRKDYVEVDTLVLDQSNVSEITSFAKSTWDGTFNEIRVTFPSREKDYADSVVLVQDLANIGFQGKIKSSNFNMPLAADPNVARRIAARSLSMMSVPLFNVELTASRVAAVLRPGDVFRLTWEPYGLVTMLFRVQTIDYGDLTSGAVVIKAVQDKFATASTLFALPAVTQWTVTDKLPHTIVDKVIMECPPFIQLAAEKDLDKHWIYILAKAPGPASIGFNGLAHPDGSASTIQVYRDKAPYPGTAKLVGDMAFTDGGAAGFLADITVNGLDTPGLFQDNPDLDSIRDGRSLFLIGGEFFMYRTFVDNLDGTFTLTDVYRGLLDSAMEDHLDEDLIYFIDGQEGLFDFATEPLSNPSPIWKIKLIDVTPFGSLEVGSITEDDIEQVSEDGGRYGLPAPPDYTRVAGQRIGGTFSRGGSANIAVTWRERNRNTSTIILVNDGTEVQEAGVLYRVRYRFNAGVWVEITGVAGTSYTIVDGGLTTGTLEVEVDSYLAGPIHSYTHDYVSVTATA